MPRTSLLLLLLLVATSTLCPPALHARQGAPEEIGILGANMLVGGATAGITAWLRGESFVRAFGKGAVGGSLQYAGKKMMTVPAPGIPFGGRLVGATGASIVRNGAAGRGMLERVILPVGPVNLHLDTRPDSGAVSPRLHLGRTIYLVMLLLRDDMAFDVGASFSAGAPIFRAPDHVLRGVGGAQLNGRELWGTVTLSDPDLLPPLDQQYLIAHERVHIVQDDFLTIAWAGPVEDWVLGRVPGGEKIGRYFELGLAYAVIGGGMLLALPYEQRPWETEADRMAGGTPGLVPAPAVSVSCCDANP